MKGKAAETKRQVVIKEILRTYGSVDHVDTLCLATRFHVDVKTITEDVRCVREGMEREAVLQKRTMVLEQERVAQLAVAKRVLRGEI
jgi:hypothetical protein